MCYHYALDLQLQATKSDCTCFYNSSAIHMIFIQDNFVAHMDASLMASTNNCHHCQWDFYSLDSSSTTLWVTDDTLHHPNGIGYFKVPIIKSPGYIYLDFYNLSLPATILSPTSIASDL